ncbi:MAG: hypothetical protein SOV73_03210 [Candidatus Faecivivens sp.]|nr:hypothetical protein [Candidatus Faecivivens sp.]
MIVAIRYPLFRRACAFSRRCSSASLSVLYRMEAMMNARSFLGRERNCDGRRWSF